MPSDKEDTSYFWDMLDAAKAIREFIRGRSYQDYLIDRMLRGAVERHLEIIGEAAGKVSKMFRDAHPDTMAKDHRSTARPNPRLWRDRA
jgi:uncharacterized protein with HEPN domain